MVEPDRRHPTRQTAPVVVVPREVALQRARAVLDAARAETAADYAAGRLTGRRLEVYERLLARRAAREAAEAERQQKQDATASRDEPAV